MTLGRFGVVVGVLLVSAVAAAGLGPGALLLVFAAGCGWVVSMAMGGGRHGA